MTVSTSDSEEKRRSYGLLATTLVVSSLFGLGGCAQSLDAHLENLERRGFDGVVYVRHNGEVRVAEAYGDAIRETSSPNTVDTLFSIGSLTKQFTGAALVRAHQEGLVDVEDTLAAHFDDVPEEMAGITLHQLASHQSGLTGAVGDDEERIDQISYLERVFATPLDGDDGSFRYSNTGYSVLAAVLERRMERSYEELIDQWFLTPHGLEQTGYSGADTDGWQVAHGYDGDSSMGQPIGLDYETQGPFYNVTGNGEFVSSVADMERWIDALAAGEVFDEEGMDLLWGEHARTGPSSHYGYGWGLESRRGGRVMEHSGANGFFAAHLLWWPDDDLLVITWSNGDEATSRLGWKLSRSVLTE